ncbi:MAG TPA: NAD(P)/FAD-dependent oxidoreductase [Candidatus Eremiobacteraceae bacterium]|nr:NAD(P)/FAD-dependent oxidoreductase [Candidatus Eremiobacteraceae bacterium]
MIIVGGGAAGLNAGLVLGRARRDVLILDAGKPRNAVAERMHGFLSRDGTPPAKLLDLARAELKHYPNVKLVTATVKRAKRTAHGFVVTAESREQFAGRRLLLANGLRDRLPSIKNLDKLWGKSVFVCPFCDGWEFRDRKIAVYGNAKAAVGLAQELYGWSKHLTVCTEDGSLTVSPKQRRWLEATHCRLIKGPIRRLVGNDKGALKELEFEDRRRIECDALFLSAPLRQSCGIAKSLGCKAGWWGSIVVDDKGRTNIRGCYAAGDAVTNVHQVILAASSGVRAAMAICSELLSEEADALARTTRRAS